MHDDPEEIASLLIKKHGPQTALEVAVNSAVEAQSRGRNYELSIWREVKLILKVHK